MSKQLYQFTALVDFWCEETQSQYVAGLSYTVRDPAEYEHSEAKKRCKALARLVPQWLAAGKIREGGPAGGVVRGG